VKLAKLGTGVLLFAAILIALGMFAGKPEPPSTTDDTIATGRRPILLELFTSEGCSSCPPADRLLETFDRTQPVSGAELIVLSEHVDYWNRLGWTDPFSSALFTERQQDYVRQLHLDSAYTPQLMIDGQKDVVGSDERAARSAILKAETHSKAAIDLRATRSGAEVMVGLGVTGGSRGTDVYVVLADDHAQSRVTRGENSGHNLHHVAVVRTLLLLGKTDAQGVFAKDLTLPLKDGNGGAWRVVVFLQDSGSRHVLGAAQTRL
jgi:hypothetical protein